MKEKTEKEKFRESMKGASVFFGVCAAGTMAFPAFGPIILCVLAIIFAYKGWMEA